MLRPHELYILVYSPPSVLIFSFKISSDLSIETLQARREWQDILKMMKDFAQIIVPSKDLIQV